MMEEYELTITNGVRSAFCSLLSRLAGEKSDKNIKDRTDVIEMEQFILYELPY